MPVRKASARKTFINNAPELTNDPAFTQVLGMLIFANEDCELPVQETSELKDERRETSSGWFTGKSRKPKSEKKEKKQKPEKQEAVFHKR